VSLSPGPLNLITDVAGLSVGQATDEAAGTGVTVLLCPEAVAAAADVRGGGPGVRETATLEPETFVDACHAVVLTGGSVFGLAAADGVVAALSEMGVGLRLRPEAKALPIVPAAVLHDLHNPGDKDWGLDPPYRRLGMEAAAAAGSMFALGAHGAGRGAMAGVLKGGIGSASLDLGAGLMAGALIASNPVGSVVMGDGETFWAWPFEIDGEFGGRRPPLELVASVDPFPDFGRLRSAGVLVPGANTTIGAVATSARLTPAECKRLAMMAQDGLARAIRPAHTPFDGDTLFAIATGAVELSASEPRAMQIARIGSALADCVARAVARGVWAARSPSPLRQVR
jgi:L-aminopeptidase/D-esterase-like protein